MHTGLLDLPSDCLVHVTSFLTTRQTMQLAAVCKTVYEEFRSARVGKAC